MAGLSSYQDVLPTELLNSMGGIAHSVQHDNVNSVLQGPVFINVKGAPYLAKGDGTTDDTAAIQAALDAGNDVVLPAGTYKLSSALSLPNHAMHIRGAGPDRTILKPDANINAFTFAAGRHGLIFEDLTIQGTAGTPTQKGLFVSALGGTNDLQVEMWRVDFTDLVYAIDTNNLAVETTGCFFERVEFSNAPLNIRGFAAHNTMRFYSCRWSGHAQNVPALLIENTGATDTVVALRDCVFESNDRSAMRLWRINDVILSNCYFEFNNTDAVANLPIVDVGGTGQAHLLVEVSHFNEAGDIVIGSTATPAQINGAILLGNDVVAGTIDRAKMPDLFEVTSGVVKFGLGDTDLFRSAAANLKTNHTLTADLGMVAKTATANGSALQVSGIAGSRNWALVPVGTGGTIGPVGGLTIYDGSGGAARLTIDTAGKVNVLNELEVDGALNHDGTTVGLNGATPVAQGAAIANADGTLADITTKFNTLLAYLRSRGDIAT